MQEKKDYSWNSSTCICEYSKYLESTLDNSVIACDDIIKVVESVSTNVTNTSTNTVPTNMTNTISTNVTIPVLSLLP